MTQARLIRVLNSRQQAYLDAMDIGIWHLREPHLQPQLQDQAQTQTQTQVHPDTDPLVHAIQAPGLKLGSGRGGVLLVCATDTDSASRLANDISRSLGAVPVWSWPDEDPTAVRLDTAVEENLFTTIAFFGDDLAARFFAAGNPASLNSANVVLLPAMDDIQKRADSRQALWSIFCKSGMVKTSEQLRR